MTNTNNYSEKLIELKVNDQNLSGTIAKRLQDKIRINEKLSSASALAMELNISNSMISKFLKLSKIEGWQTLKYIHNSFIEGKTIKKEFNSWNIKNIANEIDSSRKIMLIGVSTALFTNKDFAAKLSRLNKWVVIEENKYEQIGLSRLLTPSDILIINSISLQHSWMVDIAKSTTAKVVVISANIDKVKKIAPKHFVNLFSESYDVTASRTYTTKARIKIMKFYDKLYEEIISKPENEHLLKLTAYN